MECFIVVTVLWIFSVCLHEFGHAWAAYQGGDYTVKDKGYLTLNPIHYLHPVYSLLMPVVFMIMGGIGLPGGAVYIERHLLKSKGWDTWVSLAGVTMNLWMVFLLSTLFKFNIIKDDPQSLAAVSMAFLMRLQISAILLNLIPIPPLDGFQAIAPWLPLEAREKLFAISNLGPWILFLSLSYFPPLSHAFWGTVDWAMNFLGVDDYLAWVGYHQFRFWEH